MKTRNRIALVSLVAVCGWPIGVAHAQSPSDEYVAHRQDNSDGPNKDGARPTAPAGEEWTLQQRTTSGSTPVLDDMQIDPSLAYEATNAEGSIPFPITVPQTPDTWGPAAQGTYFHSAVLAKDTEGEFRIFAVHAVRPESGPRWVAQWYVIDPDLANFQSATAGDWQPDVVAEGRLEAEGDSYHPVIVVNRRARLSSNLPIRTTRHGHRSAASG